MREVPYSTRREALYHPEIGEALFAPTPSEDLLCAESSRLIYKKCEALREARMEVEAAFRTIGFTEVEIFCNQGSQALAAWNGAVRLGIVAFRGTEQNLADFATDLKSWKTPWPRGGTVHAGFAEALGFIWPKIEDWLSGHPGRLLMTGHSLGAALATLAASLRNPDRLVTFGSPRSGDSDFCKTLSAVEVTRYMNCCDIVCRVPPGLGFEHVGTLRYIDRSGSIQDDASRASIWRDGLAARALYALEHAWRTGNVLVRSLNDHAPLNYVYAMGTPARGV